MGLQKCLAGRTASPVAVRGLLAHEQHSHSEAVGTNLTTRLDARPGSVYVVRPDQHLAARMRKMDVGRIHRAVQRAMGGSDMGAA